MAKVAVGSATVYRCSLSLPKCRLLTPATLHMKQKHLCRGMVEAAGSRAAAYDHNISCCQCRCKRVNWKLFVLSSLLFISCVNAQLSVGEGCTSQNGKSGTCRRFPECKTAQDDLQKGIKPKICGFDLNISIVCCVIGTGLNTSGSTSSNGKSISERKCEDYSKMVTEQIVALPPVLDLQPVSFSEENCPLSGVELFGQAKVGEFPHMAAIGYKQSDSNGFDWFCGGSLISDQFVLTAAHCTSSRNGAPVVVRLGLLKLGRDDPKEILFRPPGTSNLKNASSSGEYMIANVIRHPDYRPPAKYNDIALLKLRNQVKPFSSYLRPACLYTKPTFTAKRTIATGWGQIDYAGDPSDTLLRKVLQIIDSETCNKVYSADQSTKRLQQGIVPSMICAGVLTGGKDTCQGDAGGPIQIQSTSDRCINYVIGVTSFGKFCGDPKSAGVYTRVSYYIPWIESIVWPSG